MLDTISLPCPWNISSSGLQGTKIPWLFLLLQCWLSFSCRSLLCPPGTRPSSSSRADWLPRWPHPVLWLQIPAGSQMCISNFSLSTEFRIIYSTACSLSPNVKPSSILQVSTCRSPVTPIPLCPGLPLSSLMVTIAFYVLGHSSLLLHQHLIHQEIPVPLSSGRVRDLITSHPLHSSPLSPNPLICLLLHNSGLLYWLSASLTYSPHCSPRGQKTSLLSSDLAVAKIKAKVLTVAWKTLKAPSSTPPPPWPWLHLLMPHLPCIPFQSHWSICWSPNALS